LTQTSTCTLGDRWQVGGYHNSA